MTATMMQQRLNRVSQIISQVDDEEIISMIKKGIRKQTNSKSKILVVEDEFGLQKLFKEVFLMEGYDVRTATNGDEGYETLPLEYSVRKKSEVKDTCGYNEANFEPDKNSLKLLRTWAFVFQKQKIHSLQGSL